MSLGSASVSVAQLAVPVSSVPMGLCAWRSPRGTARWAPVPSLRPSVARLGPVGWTVKSASAPLGASRPTAPSVMSPPVAPPASHVASPVKTRASAVVVGRRCGCRVRRHRAPAPVASVPPGSCPAPAPPACSPPAPPGLISLLPPSTAFVCLGRAAAPTASRVLPGTSQMAPASVALPAQTRFVRGRSSTASVRAAGRRVPPPVVIVTSARPGLWAASVPPAPFVALVPARCAAAPPCVCVRVGSPTAAAVCPGIWISGMADVASVPPAARARSVCWAGGGAGPPSVPVRPGGTLPALVRRVSLTGTTTTSALPAALLTSRVVLTGTPTRRLRARVRRQVPEPPSRGPKPAASHVSSVPITRGACYGATGRTVSVCPGTRGHSRRPRTWWAARCCSCTRRLESRRAAVPVHRGRTRPRCSSTGPRVAHSRPCVSSDQRAALRCDADVRTAAVPVARHVPQNGGVYSYCCFRSPPTV